MRKVIAAINMSLDGYCDHTLFNPDEEIHDHYAELLRSSDTVVYGRITYELMKFWKTIAGNPTGDKTMNEFARTMDSIPEKVVFSRTLTDPDWRGAYIAGQSIEKEITALKQKPGRDILVGSPGIIISCMNLNLIDEYQFCVLPLIAGKELPLFKNVMDQVDLELIKTKTFKCGAVIFYYRPATNHAV